MFQEVNGRWVALVSESAIESHRQAIADYCEKFQELRRAGDEVGIAQLQKPVHPFDEVRSEIADRYPSAVKDGYLHIAYNGGAYRVLNRDDGVYLDRYKRLDWAPLVVQRALWGKQKPILKKKNYGKSE